MRKWPSSSFPTQGFKAGACGLSQIQPSTGGYSVLVPKLLVPEFEGGTDGDGLPPDFDVRSQAGVLYVAN